MCQSCEALRINGVLCHETGCPDAHKGDIRECKECGQEFAVVNKLDAFCSEDCYAAYYELPCPDGSCAGEFSEDAD